MIGDVVVGVLLAAAVGVCAVATVGVLVMADATDRLHASGLISSVGLVLVAAAVIVDGLPAAASVELVVVVLVVVVGAPLVNHALARAIRVRSQETWDARTDVVPASDVQRGSEGP